MIVCICSALTSKCVGAAIQDGARTADDVYELCGTMRRCGSCVADIEQRIDEVTLPVCRQQPLGDTVLARAS